MTAPHACAGAVAARVRNALETTMMHVDGAAFQELSRRYGFTMVEARACSQPCPMSLYQSRPAAGSACVHGLEKGIEERALPCRSACRRTT